MQDLTTENNKTSHSLAACYSITTLDIFNIGRNLTMRAQREISRTESFGFQILASPAETAGHFYNSAAAALPSMSL